MYNEVTLPSSIHFLSEFLVLSFFDGVRYVDGDDDDNEIKTLENISCRANPVNNFTRFQNSDVIQ